MVAKMIINVPDSEIATKVLTAILVVRFLVGHAAWLAQKLCEAAIHVLNQGAVVARTVRNAAPAWKDFWREWDEARNAWSGTADNPTSQQQPPGEHAKNNHRRKRGHASSRPRRQR